MAKSANQKLKLLILKDYLLRNSDEKHPVTIPQIIEELGRYDIKAERKSIYDDLEALRVYGTETLKPTYQKRQKKAFLILNTQRTYQEQIV